MRTKLLREQFLEIGSMEKESDEKTIASLETDGWQTLIVWECEIQKQNIDETAATFPWLIIQSKNSEP